MRFFIKSYGCQMNVYDSQRMADSLIASGHVQADSPANADLFIFNTCSIREKADEKLFSDLGRVRLLKNETNGMVVVTGCVAQLRSKDIMKRANWVDIILGPQDIQYLPEKIAQKQDETEVSINLDASCKFSRLTEHFYSRGISEFITIQEGCDNFCTYCVVPFTRGREFSRSVQEILAEARRLLVTGVKEITLLGQNVNSYCGENNGKKSNLSELLFALAELPELKRLRYTTSNPQDLGEDIAVAHRDIPILAPFLHLPVQSGSDEILRRMNRKYTAGQYLDIIAMLRDYRPDIAFSSDFIVGFPGETEGDFEKTLELVEKVKYAQAYSFKYSPRPKTAAARMPDQIDQSVKEKRLAVLQELLNRQQDDFNKASLGKVLNVLFTKKGRHESQFVGRSEYAQAVSVKASDVIGEIKQVRVTEVASHSILGEVL